jgi:hypothetical protein
MRMKLFASRLMASFSRGVVVDLASADEPRAEGAVVALLQQPVIRDEIGGIVGRVGHHDRDGVALELLQSSANREPEAAWVVRFVVADTRVLGGDLLRDRPCPIRAPVS